MKQTESDKPGVIAPPPLIYLGIFILGFLCNLIFDLTIYKVSWIKYGGWFLIVTSFILASLATNTFKRAGTNLDPYRPATTVVKRGPFKFSRNPIYLSLTLIYIGLALTLNMLVPILYLPVVLIIMHYGVIIREEKYLEKKFGEKYLDYKSRVRRWI